MGHPSPYGPTRVAPAIERIVMRTLALLFICGNVITVSTAQSTSAGQGDRPSSIVLTPISTQTKVGSKVYLKLRLTNTTSRDIGARGIFLTEGIDSSFQYDCRNAVGRRVTKETPGQGLGDVHDLPALKPGQSLEENVPIDRACDLSQPGQYRIQVSASDPSDPKHVIVRSNPVSITVTP